MDRALLEDFVLHVEAVKDRYPAGIPAAAIVTGGDTCEYCGPETAELLFLFVRSEDETLRRAEQELLCAAISKGLQRPLEQVGRLAVAADAAAEQLAAAVARRRPRIVALLGNRAAELCAPMVEASGEAQVIRTPGLGEMLADSRTKKKFWADLKAIMAALGWRTP